MADKGGDVFDKVFGAIPDESQQGHSAASHFGSAPDGSGSRSRDVTADEEFRDFHSAPTQSVPSRSEHGKWSDTHCTSSPRHNGSRRSQSAESVVESGRHSQKRERRQDPLNQDKSCQSKSTFDSSYDQQERRDRRRRRRERRERKEARYEQKKEKRRNRRRSDRSHGRSPSISPPEDDVAVPTRSSRRFSHLPSTARYGLDPNDLFAAERAEKAEKEKKAWASKLSSLLHDDLAGGWDDFGSASRGGMGGSNWSEDAAWEEEIRRMRGEEESAKSGPMEDDDVHIPKRWRDAAKGQQQVRTDLMDDEEYAEYIRDGMWRRAHAADVAAQEAAAEKAKKRKAEQDAAKSARVRERIEAASKRQGVELDEARTRWEKAWSDLSSSVPKEPDGTLMQDLRYQDIPWPATRELGHPLDLGPDSLRRFLLEITPADRRQAKQVSDEQRSRASMGDADATPGSEVANARLRTALRRYHPDRFFSHHVFRRVVEGDKQRVRKAVEHVAQGLSELVGQRRA